MKITTLTSENFRKNEPRKWDLAFVGADIDIRTKLAIEYATNFSNKTFLTKYDVTQPSKLSINNVLSQASEINKQFQSNSAKSILLECTSMGTVEVLFLLRAAKDVGVNLTCLYLEPVEYSKGPRRDTAWSRDYSLSLNSQLQGVSGFTCPNKDHDGLHTWKLVAFLGYEGARLSRIFEEDTYENFQKYAVFGVPGYSPGWEMNAIANNIDLVDSNNFTSIRYCAAASVSGAYQLLRSIFEEGSDDATHVTVAPLGTKPHTIATALFLVENNKYQRTSILYDHPMRITNRSTEVRRWHQYEITFV